MGNIESSVNSLEKTNTKFIESLHMIFMSMFQHISINELEKSTEKDYCISMEKIFSTFLKDQSSADIDAVFKSIYPDDKDETNKTDKCKKTTSFYLLLYKLFTSVMIVVNPMKTNIPIMEGEYKDLKPDELNSIGLCIERILQFIYNKHSDTKVEIGYRCQGEKTTLDKDVGIPELEKLYYDEYDPETNTFTGMSAASRNKYTEDVSLFFKAFTGSTELNSDVTSFSNIKVNTVCQHFGETTGKSYTINSINDATKTNIEKYATALDGLITSYNKQLNELYDQISQVFKVDQENNVTITPNLTMIKLNEIVSSIRDNIVKMYTMCGEESGNVLKSLEHVIVTDIKPFIDKQKTVSIQKNIDILSETS